MSTQINGGIEPDVENPITALELVDQLLMHSRMNDALPRNAKIAVMVWGPSAIGKTQVIEQVARMESRKYIPFLTNIRESVDVRGLPVPDLVNRTTDWLVPGELPKMDGSDGPTLLHIDEINNGGLQIMGVMMQLINERRVGDYIVPDNCFIVASGNRKQDSRLVTEMPDPLKKRFMHYTMIFDIASLAAHAKAAKFPMVIQAFIRFRPEAILRPADSTGSGANVVTENASANPRMLERAGMFVDQPPRMRFKAYKAALGTTVGTELESFTEMFMDVPNMNDVFAHPKTAKVPSETESSQRYAIAAAIGRLADRSNFANGITYAKRLGREMEMLAVTSATDRDPKLKNTKVYSEWAVDNADITAQA